MLTPLDPKRSRWGRSAVGPVWLALCNAAFVTVALAASPPGSPGNLPLHERIDRLIEARAGGTLSPAADDYAFARRAYLDFAGRIPATDELSAFVGLRASDKRLRLIDRLLNGPEYPRRMAEAFHVMLMERRGDHPEWTAFLRHAFATNMAWDELLRHLVAADPDDSKTRGAAFFLTKRLEKYGQNPTDYPGLATDIGRLLLGKDVGCAQCHDHMFVDEYKQRDFQGLFAFVRHTFIRTDVKFPAVGEKPVKEPLTYQSVFEGQPHRTGPRLPGRAEITIPVFKPGEEYARPPDKKTRFPGVPKFSPLRALARELSARDNVDVARNAVNRLWWLLMGRGLVEPLDLFHKDNPPSHPELLDLLATEFAAHGYDIKWLLRELAQTRTYQRSSELPDGVTDPNAVPVRSYRTALERPLSAEQLTWSMLIATGELQRLLAEETRTAERSASQTSSQTATTTADPMDRAGSGTQTIATPGAQKAGSPAATVTLARRLGELDLQTDPRLKPVYQKFLAAFANPPREPEVQFAPSVRAALFVSNDPLVLGWLQPLRGNLVQRLARLPDADAVAIEAYRTVLSRPPTDEEKREIREFLARTGDRRTALADVVWALLTSTEFCVNH